MDGAHAGGVVADGGGDGEDTFAETAAWKPSEAPMDTVGAGEVTTP